MATEAISSPEKLIIQLICSAFQRCRLSEDLCRLSVVLKQSRSSDPRAFSVSMPKWTIPRKSNGIIDLNNVSSSYKPTSLETKRLVSDTGIGSSLEKFQGLKYLKDDVSAESWDGVLSIKTTGISDNDIQHFSFNLKESTPSRRLTRLPPLSKYGAKFSGTEASLSLSGSINALLANLNSLFQKMLVLKIPNIAIELAAENDEELESRYDNVFLANEFNSVPITASHAERLKSGLEDFVMRHGNAKNKNCDLCFPTWEHLKVGCGTECGTDKCRNNGLLVDTVIIVSQSAKPQSNCFRAFGTETEVLYFQNFSPCTIPQSCLNTLESFDWKSYGLILKCIEERHGHGVLKWDNLPENSHIDIALHLYDEKYIADTMIPPARQKGQPGRRFLKNALRHALDDLKNKHTGWLLSTRALKTLSYAPDLAKTMAGLILSSSDSYFKEECLSLLSLNYTEVASEDVEVCLKEKIASVIDIQDKKPRKSKEAAPLLFEDDNVMHLEFQEEAFDES